MNGNIIEQAKKVLKLRDQSLSGIVEDYFRLIIKTKHQQDTTTPILRELSGIAKSIKKPSEESIYDYLQEKYK